MHDSVNHYKQYILFLFQGATIVDRVVNITSAEDYIYIPVNEQVHYSTN